MAVTREGFQTKCKTHKQNNGLLYIGVQEESN